MIELDAICREAERRRGEPLYLATVVRIEGSSYRRPGARLLVGAERAISGCVSGGCLEDEVAKRAAFRLAQKRAVLVRYDSASDDDIGWGLGVGCNGVVDILVERLDEGPTDPLRFAAKCFREEQSGVIATVLASRDPSTAVGARVLVRDGALEASDLGGKLHEVVVEAACGADLRRIDHRDFDGVEIVFERIEPVPRLFVVGSRHDAQPLVRLAAAIGLRTTVVDAFDSITLRERFIEATAVEIVSPSELGSTLDRHRATYAVLMTHDYEKDRDYLGALLASKTRYIGVMGPRRRTERMLAELEVSGRAVNDGDLARIHAPIGLDLHAETPVEIALSILAEVQAIIAGGAGGHLRARGGAIHGCETNEHPAADQPCAE